MAQDQTKIINSVTFETGFTNTSGTLAKILVPNLPADGGTSVTSRLGGGRLIAGTIIYTGATSNALVVYIGNLTQTTGLISIGSAALIRSTAGSFLIGTDNNGGVTNVPAIPWSIGDRGVIFGANTTGNNGKVFFVEAVACSALTLHTAAAMASDGTLVGQLYRISQRSYRPIPASAGNVSSQAAVALFSSSADPDVAAQPDSGIQLGPTSAVIVAMASAASALPDIFNVSAHVLLY